MANLPKIRAFDRLCPPSIGTYLNAFEPVQAFQIVLGKKPDQAMDTVPGRRDDAGNASAVDPKLMMSEDGYWPDARVGTTPCQSRLV